MRIGVIGGGQLGQMLALAAYPLGIQVICYETGPDCPASLVTEVVTGAYDDQEKLMAFARQVDILTYEFENIPVASLQIILDNLAVPVYPPLPALKVSQDRLEEKNFFTELQIPTTHYIPINSFQELQVAVQEIGLPAVLKTRRLGYDGKGQSVLRNDADLESAWTNLQGQALLLENLIGFEREVSCIAARGVDGQIVFYPLIENEHRQGILRVSKVLPSKDDLYHLAREYTGKVLQRLDYVGVLAIEFFQKGGQLIANEMAPRVHNSGHWTIEGAQTSQFENHLRAVAGLPLGVPDAVSRAAMVNFIGELPNLGQILAIPGAHYHDYGKQARVGRKLGHATLCVQDEQFFNEQLKELISRCK